MPDPKPSSSISSTSTTTSTIPKESSKSVDSALKSVSDVPPRDTPPSELTSLANQTTYESTTAKDSILPDPAGIIDLDTFQQILDLDEPESQDFSRGMAFAYLSQAAETFQEMDEALADNNLEKLSSLGHFLKGSSAALGVTKVQASCEKMQNIGHCRDEEEGVELSKETALEKIRPLLAQVKQEFDVAANWLKAWYREDQL